MCIELKLAAGLRFFEAKAVAAAAEKLLLASINRPDFLVLKNGGLPPERFSKIFLWKIFNIYMVVICHENFFQKVFMKKKFFFHEPFFK